VGIADDRGQGYGQGQDHGSAHAAGG
jgi:hypothetical protein